MGHRCGFLLLETSTVASLLPAWLAGVIPIGVVGLKQDKEDAHARDGLAGASANKYEDRGIKRTSHRIDYAPSVHY